MILGTSCFWPTTNQQYNPTAKQCKSSFYCLSVVKLLYFKYKDIAPRGKNFDTTSTSVPNGNVVMHNFLKYELATSVE